MVKRLNKNTHHQTKCKRLFIGFALCLFVTLFTGCANRESPENIFNNYLYRLYNSLESEGDKPSLKSNIDSAIASLPRYPKRIDLLHSLNESTINLLEFLRLSQCELQRHIGERNSSLGKLQKDSQRLIYDLEFIRLASICINSLSHENPLKTVLQIASDEKQQQLPLLLWNATFASEEFSYLFSLSTGFLGASETDLRPVNVYESLTSMERMVIDNQFDQVALEAAFAVLASRKVLGEVRRSMVLLHQGLEQADNLIRQRLEEKQLCRNNQPNKQFEIVNTVFRKFYIGEVQPYIASVYQQAETSFRLIDNLVKKQQTTKAFSQFWLAVYLSDDSEWQQVKKAIKIHTLNWQALLQQCGSLPQA